MSLCYHGIITGVNNYPVATCTAHSTQALCMADPCCFWFTPAPPGYCGVGPCARPTNPDQCPGCNRCEAGGDPLYWGWQIDDNRGAMPWDITVDGSTSLQATSDGFLSIGAGRTLTTGALMLERGGIPHVATLRMLPGSKVYIVGCTFPYPA